MIIYPDTSLYYLNLYLLVCLYFNNILGKKKKIQLTLKLPQGLRILPGRKKKQYLIKKDTVTKGLILDQNISRVRCFSVPAESSNWKIIVYTKK